VEVLVLVLVPVLVPVLVLVLMISQRWPPAALVQVPPLLPLPSACWR
jgi:hypothetical protein